MPEGYPKAVDMWCHCRNCGHIFKSFAKEIRCKCRSRKVACTETPLFGDEFRDIENALRQTLIDCGVVRGRELLVDMMLNSDPYDLSNLNDLLILAGVLPRDRIFIVYAWAILVGRNVPEEIKAERYRIKMSNINAI